MADKKISALTTATTPLAGTETIPVVQSSTTKKVTVADLTAGRDVSVAGISVGGGIGYEGSMTRNAINGLSFRGVSGTSANEMAWVNSGGAVVCYVPNGTANLTVAATIAATTGTFVTLTGTTVRNGTPSEGSITSDAINGLVVRGLSGASTNEFQLRSSGGTDVLRVPTGTSNTGFGGNLIQDTAAKGINFTANTPAAGMTSQLLNWYEEGTWTPTQGAGLTVTGSFSSSGTYVRIGRQVTVNAVLSGSTTVAAAAASAMCGGLPFSSATFTAGSATSTNLEGSQVYLSGTTAYSNAAIGVAGSIIVTITYQV